MIHERKNYDEVDFTKIKKKISFAKYTVKRIKQKSDWGKHFQKTNLTQKSYLKYEQDKRKCWIYYFSWTHQKHINMWNILTDYQLKTGRLIYNQAVKKIHTE